MPWDKLQKSRLALEKTRLLKEFAKEDIRWINPHENTKIELRVVTNRGNEYCLRVHVPEDYPNSVPEMVVSESPQPMPDWDESHENHTLDRREGLVNICHSYYRRWSPGKHTIVHIFKKGRQWLEAYESSVETKRPMDFYLDDVDVLDDDDRFPALSNENCSFQ